MKKLLILMVAALMLSGCVVYPGYDYGYYDTGYYPYVYPYPYVYGYAGPSVDFVFTNIHGGHGFHHGFHGGHGGWHGGGWRGGRRH